MPSWPVGPFFSFPLWPCMAILFPYMVLNICVPYTQNWDNSFQWICLIPICGVLVIQWLRCLPLNQEIARPIFRAKIITQTNSAKIRLIIYYELMKQTNCFCNILCEFLPSMFVAIQLTHLSYKITSSWIQWLIVLSFQHSEVV